jgi:hypothetical protein
VAGQAQCQRSNVSTNHKEMLVTLPLKLALVVVVLAVLLVVMLYHVHQATQFQAIDPRGRFGDFPVKTALNTSVRRISTDENSEREMEEVVEEVEEKREQMNILLFYAVDWRHDILGAAGNPIVKTPVLDAIAAEGVRFSENCVTTSICWISCATLYSGQYLARHHFVMLRTGRTIIVNGTEANMGFEVPQNETIYSLLKQKAGYTTAHVGKLGLLVFLDQELNFDFFVHDEG